MLRRIRASAYRTGRNTRRALHLASEGQLRKELLKSHLAVVRSAAAKVLRMRRS